MPSDYYPSGPFIRQLARDDEFEVAREDFLFDCRTERTARAYKTDLEDFRQWCSAHRVDPMAPTEENITEWVRDLHDRGYSSGTIARRRAALQGFLRYLASTSQGRKPTSPG